MKVENYSKGSFYFLITYGVCKKRKYCFFLLSHHGVCKKRKYCNRMSEKKKFSPFDKCLSFLCLIRQDKQKKIPSVCLSGCLDVRTYVDFSCGHNNF